MLRRGGLWRGRSEALSEAAGNAVGCRRQRRDPRRKTAGFGTAEADFWDQAGSCTGAGAQAAPLGNRYRGEHIARIGLSPSSGGETYGKNNQNNIKVLDKEYELKVKYLFYTDDKDIKEKLTNLALGKIEFTNEYLDYIEEKIK